MFASGKPEPSGNLAFVPAIFLSELFAQNPFFAWHDYKLEDDTENHKHGQYYDATVEDGPRQPDQQITQVDRVAPIMIGSLS